MAILRGGKRIGGMDVRIGIPRDRSLDNVAGDPRLKRNQGFGLNQKGQPETTIGRFQSYVNEAEGFARKARYYAEFELPRGIKDFEFIGLENIGDGTTSPDKEELSGFARQ